MEPIQFEIGDFFFSWDEQKSRANLKNHGVHFQEAATCWLDGNAVEGPCKRRNTLANDWKKRSGTSFDLLVYGAVVWRAGNCAFIAFFL
jgi:hypothetical protein